MERTRQKVTNVPYEELQITRLEANQYGFHAPWLSLKVNLETTQETHNTLTAFAGQNYEQVNLQILSDLLGQLNLPFNYVLPDIGIFGNSDQHNLKPNLPDITKQEFNWDLEAILEFSKVGENLYSPVSI